jgi:hypothetical protein
LSEEALEAYYQELVLSDQETYAPETLAHEHDETETYEESGGASFGTDVADGALITYIPSGYRAVKQILLMPDDEDQEARLLCEQELADINIAMENEVATGEQAARKPIVEAMLQALDAKFQSLVDEVMEKVDAGEDFEALIAQYGQDPGMFAEPFKTNGYYVSASCTGWDPGFVAAAMSLENQGDVSEPFAGVWYTNGVFIVRYEYDLVPGPVPFAEVRDAIAEGALSAMKDGAFQEAVGQWYAEAEITYYYENMR